MGPAKEPTSRVASNEKDENRCSKRDKCENHTISVTNINMKVLTGHSLKIASALVAKLCLADGLSHGTLER